MSSTIPVEEAQTKLKDLIHTLAPGDEIILTENHQPVARLVSETARPRKPRVPGNCKGIIDLRVEDERGCKLSVRSIP